MVVPSGSSDDFTGVGTGGTGGLMALVAGRWRVLVEWGIGDPLVTYTITGSVTATTG